jgi:leader peptidase (prepilin peptidase)/N-methyltransferase
LHRLVALVAAAIALSCTLDEQIPLTTGVVLIALLPAVLVDLIDRRLPNRLVGGAAAVGLGALLAEWILTDFVVAPRDVLLGVLALTGPLLVIHMISPAAMGFGDVKAAAVTGAALGLVDPVAALAALAIGSAGTALVGVALRRPTVAFGPGVVGGAICALVIVASPLGSLDLDGNFDIFPIGVAASGGTGGATR